MTELEQLTAEIKRATDYQVNKRILREKILTDLHMPYNGGLFKISPELIAFVATWPNQPLYLEDTYQNPIEITDPDQFLTRAREHYQRVMNTWHQQHEELKKLRRV